MLNFNLLKNPINWAVVMSMAMIGIIVASIISSPLRAAQPAS